MMNRQDSFLSRGVGVHARRGCLGICSPFINLYGYGYENIYELGELVSTTDEGVNWVTSLQTP